MRSINLLLLLLVSCGSKASCISEGRDCRHGNGESGQAEQASPMASGQSDTRSDRGASDEHRRDGDRSDMGSSGETGEDRPGSSSGTESQTNQVGPAGSSCTVTQLANVARITCPDGTEAIVYGMQTGKKCKLIISMTDEE